MRKYVLNLIAMVGIVKFFWDMCHENSLQIWIDVILVSYGIFADPTPKSRRTPTTEQHPVEINADGEIMPDWFCAACGEERPGHGHTNTCKGRK